MDHQVYFPPLFLLSCLFERIHASHELSTGSWSHSIIT